MAENKKRNFLERLKYKYRLTVYNDTSLEEVTTFYLSRLNVFTYFGLFLIFVTIIVFLLLVFTPLKVFLPAYTDAKMQRQIIENALKVDSLEQEIMVRDKYFQTISHIIQGKDLSALTPPVDTTNVTPYENITFEKSKEDSLLRLAIEKKEMLNTTSQKSGKKIRDISKLHFFSPINKGMIINRFSASEGHYGVDIVAAPNEGVLATLDGTVVAADWTLETGYVIQIQHEDNLVSFYKHNSALLKKVGDRVMAGEVVAIIGNSGELTTGPHLHFELWHRGMALNPEEYIVF